MSSFTDTKERQKVVDFVTYFTAGTSFYVKTPADRRSTRSPTSAATRSGSRRGTTQADDAKAQSAKCKAAGKAGVKVAIFPTRTRPTWQSPAAAPQVGMADSPVAAYIVKQSNGQFKVTGKSYGTAPYGIAIPKGNGMAKPVLDALKKLMANGTYKKILTKWGVPSGAITNPTINGATS